MNTFTIFEKKTLSKVKTNTLSPELKITDVNFCTIENVDFNLLARYIWAWPMSPSTWWCPFGRRSSKTR
jgi:hypothetical protein